MKRPRRWPGSAAVFGLTLSLGSAAFAQEQLPGGGPAPAPMAPEAAPTPSPSSPPPARSGEGEGLEWKSFKLEGVHPFIGATFLGGPAFLVGTGAFALNDTSLQGAFLFALRAGVYIDRNELAFEISPLTYQYYTNTPGPAFQFTATYGYLIPVAKASNLEISWPIRIGAGMMAANTGGLAFFQARTDLVGLNIRTGPLIIDLYFPQFRYAVTSSEGEGVHLLTWFGGASLSYAL